MFVLTSIRFLLFVRMRFSSDRKRFSLFDHTRYADSLFFMIQGSRFCHRLVSSSVYISLEDGVS